MPGTAKCTRVARRGCSTHAGCEEAERARCWEASRPRPAGLPCPTPRGGCRKARELVKLLALADGHRLHREQAMDALWPRSRPGARRRTISTRPSTRHGARSARRRSTLLDEPALARSGGGRRSCSSARRRRRDASERPGPASARSPSTGGELLPGESLRRLGLARARDGSPTCTRSSRRAAVRPRAALGRPCGRCRPTTSAFVGRERRAGRGRPLCWRPTRLVTLTGAGGGGKTRLALRGGRRRCSTGTRTALGGRVGPLPILPGGGGAVAAALGVREQHRSSPCSTHCAATASRASAAGARQLRAPARGCAGLVGRLLRGARGHGAGDEPGAARRLGRGRPGACRRWPPRPGDLAADRSALNRSEAARLFVDRAVRSAGLRARRRGRAGGRRICRRLDGIPLALELAAARVGALSRQIARAWTTASGCSPAGAAPRCPASRRCGRRSTGATTCSTPERAGALRRLAVFAGGSTLEAAEAVCAGGGSSGEVAASSRDSPTRPGGGGGGGQGEARYRLLETVRQYVAGAARRLRASAMPSPLGTPRGWCSSSTGSTEEIDRARPGAGQPPRSSGEPARRGPAGSAAPECRGVAVLAASRSSCARRATGSESRSSARRAIRRNGSRHCSATRLSSSARVTPASAWPRSRKRWRSRDGSATQRSSGGRSTSAAAVEIADDDGVLAASYYEPALAFAREHGLAAAEAVSAYSLGAAAWVAADVAEATRLCAESFELFGALEDSEESVPALVNVAEMIRLDPDAPGVRLAFEDTLAAVRRHLLPGRGRLCPAQLGERRSARWATTARRGRCSSEGLAHFERIGSDQGSRGRVGASRLTSSCRPGIWTRRLSYSSALGDCGSSWATGAAVRSRSSGSGRWRHGGPIMREPRTCFRRRWTSSAGPAIAGGSPRRSGGAPTSSWLAVGRPPPRSVSRRPSPWSARRAVCAGGP